MKEEQKSENANRINFRPILFCALGLVMGIFLYAKIRFGGLVPSDFLFAALFFLFAVFPLKKVRTLAVFLSLCLFAGAGALALHLYTERFLPAAAEGEYRLTGTVTSVSAGQGYSVLVLDDLTFDGEEQRGKCRAVYGGNVRPGDILSAQAKVQPVDADDLSDPYVQSDFSKGVRYTASLTSAERTGRSNNLFLRMNAALYDTLHGNMERDEADLAYALLTGNAGGMDEDLSEAVRRGGIAHIFAVSGLHIGILYAAAYACFPFLKKYRFLPALLLSLLYCGLCNFTVSSVRAVIMCGTLGVTRAFGKKYDFLESVSLAALLTLLILPQQWFSAGMRLSYGACLGLALLAAPLRRVFRRVRFPRFLAEYLSASLSVQIFLFPVMLETFGYVSALAAVVNLFIAPVVPVLFLGTLLCALLALVVPPAAGFFLLFPEGMFSTFLYVFSVLDVSLVIAGFALGAGSAVFLTGCVALSGRVRLSGRGKGAAAVALAALFLLVTVLQNVVFTGCRIEVLSRNGNSAALVRTGQESVLLIDGEISVSDCEDFLDRTYGGRLSAVVVLAEDELSGVNTACFLPAEEVRVCDECETGLKKETLSGRAFTVGGLTFRFESRSKLMMLAEGCAVEFDFEGTEALGADLFVGEAEGRAKRLNYLLKDAIIKTL